MIMDQALFRGMTDREADETMRCLKAVRKEYSKDSYIHHAGDIISSLAIIESGSVLIVQEDFWGNRNIIMEATANESFGEVFAVTRTPLSVSVVAKSDVTFLLVDTDRIMSPCSRQCASHNTLISNLLEESFIVLSCDEIHILSSLYCRNLSRGLPELILGISRSEELDEVVCCLLLSI